MKNETQKEILNELLPRWNSFQFRLIDKQQHVRLTQIYFITD